MQVNYFWWCRISCGYPWRYKYICMSVLIGGVSSLYLAYPLGDRRVYMYEFIRILCKSSPRVWYIFFLNAIFLWHTKLCITMNTCIRVLHAFSHQSRQRPQVPICYDSDTHLSLHLHVSFAFVHARWPRLPFILLAEISFLFVFFFGSSNDCRCNRKCMEI